MRIELIDDGTLDTVTGSRALDSEGGYFDEGGFFHKVSK